MNGDDTGRCTAYILAMRWVLLALAALPTSLFGGVVRTLDGRVLYGDIRLEADGKISVAGKDGKPARVELGDVLSAHFRSEAIGGDVRPQARWMGRDIGGPRLPGEARFAGEALTVRASGVDIAGAHDQLHFVFQTLTGDGQIVARVASVQLSSRKARAGLMVRAGLDHAAPCAMAAVSAAEGVQFHARPRLSQQMTISNGSADNPPVWLKLVRKGQEISGFSSLDGADWTLIATARVALPPQCQIGLAVCSANPTAICTATFEKVTITTGTADDAKLDPAALQAGMVLRDGSFVAGRVKGADRTSARIDRGAERAIARADLARLILNPVKREWLDRIPPGRPGLLLASGDYLECSLQEVGDGVKVTSVLFGQRRFETAEVLVAALEDAPIRPAMHEVLLADGSSLRAERVAVEADALRVFTRSLGELRCGTDQIIEVKAGASRQQALADLKPAQLEGAAGQYAANALPAGLPMRLAGQAVERGIGLGAGVTASYELGGEYRVLLARAGVPEGVLPANPVQLVISGDGRELYRSPPRTSLDEPLAVMVSLSGVRRLSVRVEGQVAGGVGAAMFLADASIIR